jgi:hypothetical protein
MRWSERGSSGLGALAARAAVGLGVVAAAALAMVLAGPAVMLAASPTPDPVGDPRSSGQGPGLVGDPLMAIGIVIAIAVLALVVTVAYVRVTAGRQERRTP